MKKFNFSLVFIFIFSLILAGCGVDKDKDNAGNQVQAPVPIKVTIQLPDKIDPGQEVQLKAVVTQDGKAVVDADEVEFEVWESTSEDHEKIAAKHVGDGVYAIKKTFDAAGVYEVIAHVTARDMHTMPQQQFTVGTPTPEQQQAADEEHEHADGGDHEHSASESNHHDSGIVIDLKKDETIKANTDVKFIATIKQDDQPVAGAYVQLEVWKENTSESDKQWVVSKETSDGVYEMVPNFKDAGSYLITVHVKKGDLHDHLEQAIKVQ